MGVAPAGECPSLPAGASLPPSTRPNLYPVPDDTHCDRHARTSDERRVPDRSVPRASSERGERAARGVGRAAVGMVEWPRSSGRSRSFRSATWRCTWAARSSCTPTVRSAMRRWSGRTSSCRRSTGIPCSHGWTKGHRKLVDGLAALQDDAELVLERPAPWRMPMRREQLIAIVMNHDVYHSGEINRQRALIRGVDRKPAPRKRRRAAPAR